jgi:hypothetical protein
VLQFFNFALCGLDPLADFVNVLALITDPLDILFSPARHFHQLVQRLLVFSQARPDLLETAGA